MGGRMYYTLGQARIQLGKIDWKTLNKWLNAAGINPEPDPKDSRVKRISRTQLQRLASLHGVALSGEDALLPARNNPQQSLPSLTTNVEHLQQSLEALTSSFDERFEQAAHRLDASLQEGLREVRQELITSIREVFRELFAGGEAMGGHRATDEGLAGRSMLHLGDTTAPLSPKENSDTEV